MAGKQTRVRSVWVGSGRLPTNSSSSEMRHQQSSICCQKAGFFKLSWGLLRQTNEPTSKGLITKVENTRAFQAVY